MCTMYLKKPVLLHTGQLPNAELSRLVLQTLCWQTTTYCRLLIYPVLSYWCVGVCVSVLKLLQQL